MGGIRLGLPEFAMSKKLGAAFILLGLLTVLTLQVQVRALGGPTLTAFTGNDVAIDGSLGSAEWSDGDHLSFAWSSSNSSITGGGEVWTKNNGTDLLIAVSTNARANRTASDMDLYLYTLYLLFDNDNDGTVENLDDGKSLALTFHPSVTTQVREDLHYDSANGQYTVDTYRNGTAAGSHTNPGGPGGFTWEFAIPLSSVHPEDFTLAVNGSIGFEIVYAEQRYLSGFQVSSGWAYWEVSYQNGLPSGPNPSANGWAVIIRTDSQLPVSDNTPPTIDTPTIQPSSPSPGDTVTVTMIVWDAGSGVKNVSIAYTTDNWSPTNITVTATYDGVSQLATVQVPAQSNGERVSFYIVAFDNAGNRALNNNVGNYFGYDVLVPLYLNNWFYLALAVIIASLLFFVLLYVRRRKRPVNSTFETSSLPSQS